MGTLQESDAVLQTKTAQSLGAIGDRRAVPALIRLLVRRQGQTNHKLCDYAAQALISLGEEETVSAFADALEGRLEALPSAAKKHRADLIEGLIASLEGPGRVAVTNTVAALAKIGAVEVLPELRQRVNDYMLASVRASYRDAIEALEARTNLPRPAPALEPRADILPKPASHERGGRREHFAHSGTALRPFVADDDDITLDDRAVQNALEGFLFRFKNAG